MYKRNAIQLMAATAVCGLATLAGCVGVPQRTQADIDRENALVNAQPESLRPLFTSLYEQGEWGSVLNLERLGVAAIDAGHPEIAKASLDMAIARIESVYADNPTAAKARSLWSAEGVKDYKGEPYERSMAYYYRGLLYLADNDYQNARAMFKSGEYQDTITENQTYSSNFGLLTTLAGWASHCDSDESAASDFYQQAKAQQPSMVIPDAGANTLVLVELGTSPVKTAGGKYQELLQPRPGSVSIDSAAADGASLIELADISTQATTLGGRQVDSILQGKANFKDTTKDVAKAGMEGAMVGAQLAQQASAAGNYQLGNAGAIFSLVSLAISGASAIASASATPKADIRYWDNIPAGVWGTFSKHDLSVPIPLTVNQVSLRPEVDQTAGACRVVLARNGTTVPNGAPATNMTPSEIDSVLSRNDERDRAFRNELAEHFAVAQTTAALGGAQ